METKQLKQQLALEYPYRIELHAHSLPASPCSEVSPEELVDIYADAGYDGMVLANHFFARLIEENTLEGYLSDYNRAVKRGEERGIRVYLAAEVRFAENINDYLLYGADEEILRKTTQYFSLGLAEFYRNGKDPRSVLVQAHPFRNGMTLMDPELVDGFEVFNLHSGHNSRVGTTAVYARQHQKTLLIGGTDFHHPNTQTPSVALRTRHLPEDSFDIAAILKSGDYLLEIGDTLVLP